MYETVLGGLDGKFTFLLPERGEVANDLFFIFIRVLSIDDTLFLPHSSLVGALLVFE